METETRSAYENFLYIAEKVGVLESLYQQAVSVCVGLNNKLQGYGRLHMDNIISDTVPATYLETMNIIGTFLKLLSGETISAEESRLFNRQHYTGSNLNLFFNSYIGRKKGNFEAMLDTYINWLNETINKCNPINKEYKPITSNAYNNLIRIAKRIQLMETFYYQVLETCRGLENYIMGYGTITRANPEYDRAIEQYKSQYREETRYTGHLPVFYDYRSSPVPDHPRPETLPPKQITVPITFYNVMNDIYIALKFLSGQELTSEDESLQEHNIFADISSGLNLYDTLTLPFDSKVEPYILWLFEVLNQCRATKSGINTAQQIQVQNLYSPSGQIAQAASQRFYTTAASQRKGK